MKLMFCQNRLTGTAVYMKLELIFLAQLELDPFCEYDPWF